MKRIRPSPATRNSTLRLAYLYGGVVHYHPGESLRERILPDYELVLIIEGRVRYEANGVAHDLTPGALVLAHPGLRESYRWDPGAPTRHAYLHFDLVDRPHDWPDAVEWPTVITHPPDACAPLFRQILERVAAHPEWPTVSPDREAHCMMETLIDMLLASESRVNPISERLPEAVSHALNLMREQLDERPHQHLRLRDMARRSGVTEKHLCRVFSKALGHAPMKTFQLLKLQLALALLARSNLSVKGIADRCGFEDPLYFTRCFRRVYGAPPTEVRQSLMQGHRPPRSPLPAEVTPRIHW